MTICQWFAMCENMATTTVDHPILGEVPACERCALVAKGNEGHQSSIAADGKKEA